MIFRFAQPEFLWLLLLIPLLFFLKGRFGNRPALKFPSVRLISQIAAFVRSRPGRWHASLRWLALTCFILALARPQTGTETTEISHSGVDILIAVDLSESMWAHDFEVAGVPQDRLTVVKSVAKKFIENRPYDRIGLLAFSSEPYLASPLTLNHKWVLKRLADLQIGNAGSGKQTAIGSAIGSGVKRLRDLDAESKLVILVTDGSNNAGLLDPTQAAEAAAAYGIKVYTIGVGEEGRVRYPVFGYNGQIRRNANGQPFFQTLNSEIDLDTLKEVADLTKARYFHATNLEGLEQVYSEIDTLEKSEAKFEINRLYSEKFIWALSAGLVLLLANILLNQTIYRRLP